MSRFDSEEEREDDYGPGSDLVLSLLATLILVLGLIGVGEHLPRSSSGPPHSDDYQDKLNELSAKNKELADQVRLLLRQSQSNPRASSIDLGEIIEVEGLEPFAKGSAQLTPAGESQIRKLLKLSIARLASADVNLLQIEGHASPEPNQRKEVLGDANVELSALRAASVAHYLNKLGMPYACVAVIGHGRARSRLIKRITGGGGNEAMSQWDQLFEDAKFRNDLQTRFSNSLRADRRVVLKAVMDDASYCSGEQFFAGLDLISKSP
ncbi:MAG: OmpA family protein [Alphaproteobacteria bacterium]|nr:OmpA family protein [Alphaproteobacteria bacterium]